MKEEKTSKRRILTEVELKNVNGGECSGGIIFGRHDFTNTNKKNCVDIKTMEECKALNGCFWTEVNKTCNTISIPKYLQ